MRIYLAPILHPSCTHLAPKFLKCRLVSCANCLIHSIYDDNPLFRKLMIIFLTLFGFSGFFGIHLLIPKTSKITKKTKISVESVKSVWLVVASLKIFRKSKRKYSVRAGHLFLKSLKNRKRQKPIIFSVLFGFSSFFGILVMSQSFRKLPIFIPKTSKITKKTKISV